MFYINWRFTLIALAVAPALFAIVYSYTRRIKKATREVRKKEGEMVSIVQEVLSSIHVVRAFGREDYEQHRLEEQSLEGVEVALRARGLKARLLPLVQIIVAVGYRGGALVWRQDGPGERPFRGSTDHFHFLSGKNVQAHAGPFENDGLLFKGCCGL